MSTNWAVERFIEPFKKAGYVATYVQTREKYLDALRHIGANHIIIFSYQGKDHVILSSDTQADTFTVTFKENEMQLR